MDTSSLYFEYTKNRGHYEQQFLASLHDFADFWPLNCSWAGLWCLCSSPLPVWMISSHNYTGVNMHNWILKPGHVFFGSRQMHSGTLLHHRTMRRWWNQASNCVHCATGAVMSHQCSVFYRTQIVSSRPRQFQGRSCSHDNNPLQWSITAINRQSIMQLIYMNCCVQRRQMYYKRSERHQWDWRVPLQRLHSAIPRDNMKIHVFLSKIRTKKRTSQTKINPIKVECAR